MNSCLLKAPRQIGPAHFATGAVMEDPDTAVLPYLISGVPIGIDSPILPSHCFPPADPIDFLAPRLLTVHHTNWSTAENHPEEVMELIQKEIDQGWVVEYPGSLQDARAFFEP